MSLPHWSGLHKSIEVNAMEGAPLYYHDTEDRVQNNEYTRILRAAIETL